MLRQEYFYRKEVDKDEEFNEPIFEKVKTNLPKTKKPEALNTFLEFVKLELILNTSNRNKVKKNTCLKKEKNHQIIYFILTHKNEN